MKRWLSSVVLPAVLIFASACSPPPASSFPPGVVQITSAAPPTPGPAREIPLLARFALACRWVDTTGFDPKCPAFADWDHADEGFEDGRSDAGLVAMLASADVRIRALAAWKLGGRGAGQAFVVSKPLSRLVIAAAERETNPLVARLLGTLAGHIDLEKTRGLSRRLEALVTDTDNPDLAAAIVEALPEGNPSSKGVADRVKAWAKDPRSQVRVASMAAFARVGYSDQRWVCNFWGDHVQDSDHAVANKAMTLIVLAGCAEQLSPTLDEIQSRVEDGHGAVWTATVTHICKAKTLHPDLRQRAVDIGTVLASSTDQPSRRESLPVLEACDAKAARAVARKLAKDADPTVRGSAQKLLQKK